MVWYDKHRKCRSGEHEGKLELITWEGKDEDGTMLGFGAVLIDEADDLRREFETKFKGDEALFFEYRPYAFRWTCCGCTGDMDYGCDHHGSGSTPCTCDFCHLGKPVPRSIFMQNQQATRGLQLSRGPDPRSYDPIKAGIAAAGRGLFGMPMGEDEDEANDASAGNVPLFPHETMEVFTNLFSQSPNAAAAIAQLQRGLEAAQQHSTASPSSSSSRGARATGSSGGGSGSKGGTSKAAGSSSSSSRRAAAAEAPAGSGQKQQGSSAAVKTWVCIVCGVEKPVKQMFACSGCRKVKKRPYCSKDCQVADWPNHKEACRRAQQAAAAAAAAGTTGASQQAPQVL